MKQFKRFGLVVTALLLTVTMAFAAKPNIHILATGGTIAGTEVPPPEPVTRQDRLPSAHCSMLFPRLKTSPT